MLLFLETFGEPILFDCYDYCVPVDKTVGLPKFRVLMVRLEQIDVEFTFVEQTTSEFRVEANYGKCTQDLIYWSIQGVR